MIPYDKRTGKIWYNGELVDWSEVKVHVLSHGLHYASSGFEGERSYSGRIFKLHEHTERLFFSASELDFDIPYSIEEIKTACYSTLEKNNLVVKRIKENFDLSPRGIREMLDLNKPIYEKTSAYGHFGRASESNGSFSWEKTDKTSIFSK